MINTMAITILFSFSVNITIILNFWYTLVPRIGIRAVFQVPSVHFPGQTAENLGKYHL